jgi:transposase
LRGWKGTLQTDGYSGYDEVIRTNGLIRAGCWAHARRKVKDALEARVTKAVVVLRPIQRLFWIERAVKRRAQARGLTTEQRNQLRADVRRRLSSRITKRIHERALQIRDDPSILPKSTLGKAVRYIDNQLQPLTRFLEDPGLEIHNNDSERTLRHVVTGRKNWLHFGSPRGGQVGCHLFSLVATCKALQINPQAYLEDLLEKVDTVPASQIARLTPWAWAREADATQGTVE